MTKNKKENKKQKLRIWHNSNFGNDSFYQDVPNVERAIILLNVLAEYDLYQGDKVVANAQGLEVWDEKAQEWYEWGNEDGDDISVLIDNEK